MALKLKKHPNGFYYAYPTGRNPFSLKTKSKEEAERIVRTQRLEEAEQAHRLGTLTPQFIQRIAIGRRVTVKQAVADYLAYLPSTPASRATIHHSQWTLGAWVRDLDLGDNPLTDVQLKHIDRWVNRPGRQKFETRKRTLADLRGFLHWAHSLGLIGHNPAAIADVKAELLPQAQRLRKERAPFTDQEIARLLSELKPGDFWHAAVLLSYETGLRLRDCALLQRASLIGRTLSVGTVKSGRGGNTVVTHRLSDQLLDSLGKAEGTRDYFFADVAADFHNQPVTAHAKYSTQFIRLCRRLGIEGKSFHGIRHTFAMRTHAQERHRIFNEVLNELTIQGVAKVMGHKSGETTKIYLKHLPQK